MSRNFHVRLDRISPFSPHLQAGPASLSLSHALVHQISDRPSHTRVRRCCLGRVPYQIDVQLSGPRPVVVVLCDPRHRTHSHAVGWSPSALAAACWRRRRFWARDRAHRRRAKRTHVRDRAVLFVVRLLKIVRQLPVDDPGSRSGGQDGRDLEGRLCRRSLQPYSLPECVMILLPRTAS